MDMLNEYTELLAAREMTARPWVEQMIRLREQCKEVTASIDEEIDTLSKQIIETGTIVGEDTHGRSHSVLVDRIPDISSENILGLARGKSVRECLRWNTFVHIVKCGKKTANSS